MKKIFKNMEYKLIIIVALLAIIGCIALWSATKSTGDNSELIKQMIWFAAGTVVMLIVALVDYHIYEKFWVVLYIGSLVLLGGVLFMPAVNGASSWYFLGPISFQPSEVAKICTIISIAAMINKISQNGEGEISKIKNLIRVFIVLFLPVILIVLQPDYGTAMTFFVFTIVMLFMAKIDKKYIIIGVAIIAITLPLLYLFVLPEHARNRIDVYFDPTIDPLGKGYNILQSKLAIGSGKLTGMGIGEGNQTQLGYLYPKTTDFIFAVIAEEMGFIVAGFVIMLFTVFLIKMTNISRQAKDRFGSLLAIGIMGMFMFYVTENIGMTMGVLPITGVPLPFVSYGGSSIVTNMVAIGILLNISGQRDKIVLIGEKNIYKGR